MKQATASKTLLMTLKPDPPSASPGVFYSHIIFFSAICIRHLVSSRSAFICKKFEGNTKHVLFDMSSHANKNYFQLLLNTMRMETRNDGKIGIVSMYKLRVGYAGLEILVQTGALG